MDGRKQPKHDQMPQIWRLLEDAQNLVYRYRLRTPRGTEYAVGPVRAITGHSAAEFYADPDLADKAVHPEDRPLLSTKGAATIHWNDPVTIRWIHADGRIVWAEHRRAPVLDEDGRLVAVEGVARDITSLVEAQRQLRQSQDQLRELAARLQTTREQERATLARELHDELGQTLTALKLELARTTQVMLDESVTETVINRLQSLVGLVEIGLTMVKRLATSLRPPELDHLGLGEAIRWEARAFTARSGVRSHIEATSDGDMLAETQKLALFRIFQEALTNVVRHAHASAVRVRLRTTGRVFELRISDNGRGITSEQAASPQSIGLLGMRERATQVGAILTINGQRGRGTVVAVEVPLAAARRGERPHARTKRHDSHPAR